MSRFFKSAAFPILIVVVLAFFAQKLIGNSSHSPHYTFGNLLYQLDNNQVKSLSIHTKDNTVDVTTSDNQKYTVGYPDDYAATLINRAHSQGRAAVRTAGHRQDAARAGRRRRGWRAVLLDLWLGLRRDVRRRRCLARA